VPSPPSSSQSIELKLKSQNDMDTAIRIVKVEKKLCSMNLNDTETFHHPPVDSTTTKWNRHNSIIEQNIQKSIVANTNEKTKHIQQSDINQNKKRKHKPNQNQRKRQRIMKQQQLAFNMQSSSNEQLLQ
jgi:hypothetical protein